MVHFFSDEKWNLFSVFPSHTTLSNHSCFQHSAFNPAWAGGFCALEHFNVTFYWLIKLSKILWIFLKFTWENFVKIFFSCFRQLLLRSSFLNKGSSCEIENIWKIEKIENIHWSKRFIFWNIFLYCKIIVSFLEIFSATCFLCILQTQLVFWYCFLFWIYFSLCMQVMMYNYSLWYIFTLSSSRG